MNKPSHCLALSVLLFVFVLPLNIGYSAPEQSFDCLNYDVDAKLNPVTGNLREPTSTLMEGRFPQINEMPGAEYSVFAEPDTPELLEVTLDGKGLVFGNNVAVDYGNIPAATANTVMDAEQFLSDWSTCASTANVMAMLGFIDSNSYNWLCDEYDRFHVQASPLALMCFGSAARTKGSLPLELYFVGQLSDTRAVLVIGEGTNHDECGLQIGFRSHVSIWVVENLADDVIIRAAIGGLETMSDEFKVIGPTECELVELGKVA